MLFPKTKKAVKDKDKDNVKVKVKVKDKVLPPLRAKKVGVENVEKVKSVESVENFSESRTIKRKVARPLRRYSFGKTIEKAKKL